MAKIFSQLEKAQLENTTSDTASHPKGMITYRTDLNQAKVSNGTAYKLLIDEDSSQTLSNKTYASPITSGAITSAQTTTPASPASGENKLYFKADGKLYTLDSAGNEALVGSGGGGGVKNLIANGSADETSSSIFVPYADSGTRPTDGTGGSPTVTTSVTSTVPLDGVKSYLLTKPASNVQGQGWAVPFTVDPAYRAKSLKISADFIVNSGTFVAGSNGASPTDGDLIWTVYDVTNSVIIEPSNIKMFSQSSTISDKFEATFQTSATGASYRLIAHVASTSALAFELKVDNITVSPSNYVYGTPITDWVAYTPVYAGLGTVTTTKAFYRRVGQNIEVAIRASTGTHTAVEANISLPSGLSIDTTTVGSARITGGTFKSSIASNDCIVETGTLSTNMALTAIGAAETRLNGTGLNSSQTFDLIATFPIVGWSSSVQMSDSADTRVIVGGIQSSGTTSVGGTATKIAMTTALDSTGGITDEANSRFLIASAGYYVFTASTAHAAVGTLNSRLILSVYKNGSEVWSSHGNNGNIASNTVVFTTSTPPIQAKAGDYFEMYFKNDSGSSASVSGKFYAQKVNGPSAIAASESINAKYTTTAGSSFTDGVAAIVDFGTKEFDSHSAVTTGGSWKFTAPVSGVYTINGHIGFSIPTGTRYQINALLRKNETETNRCLISTTQNSTNGSTGLPFNFMLKLNAEDYIDLQVVQDSGASRTLLTTAGLNAINIARIGN